MSRLTLAVTTVALGLCLSPTLRADVLVVEQGGPPGTHPLLSSAVAAASDGDLIRVLPGTYLDVVVIDGKALTIVGEGNPQLKAFQIFGVTTLLEIANLAADQSVVVQGLLFDAAAEDPANLVTVRDCAGAVLFEDCLLDAAADGSGISSGLEVLRCDSVSLARCDVDGGFGLFGQVGIAVLDSTLLLERTAVRGSDGQDAGVVGFQLLPPGSAGRGLVVVGDSDVLAVACTFEGGDGGDAQGECFAGEDGQPALELFASARGVPLVRQRDCLFLGGFAGGGGCAEPGGVDAADVVVHAGQVLELAGAPRHYATTSPVSEGQDVTLFLHGEPGDLAALVLSASLAPALPLGPTGKALHLSLPLLLVEVGVVPAGGNLVLELPVPDLGPGVDFLAVAGQALFAAGDGTLTLASPSVAVLLDVP